MSKIAKIIYFSTIAVLPAVLGNTVVAPNNNTQFTGNASADIPKTATSLEFQQVIGTGNIHSVPITITALAFRAKPGTGAVSGSIGVLNVYLSTSPNFPNSNGGVNLMSTTLANNVGKDKTLVFSDTNIALKSPGCVTPGPCPFDLILPLQTPFVYAASSGPLLIDLVEENIVATTGTFDAASFSAPGGNVASVTATAGAATGTFAYQGDVIQITYNTTAPALTGVVNVASNVPPGMPNYAIAQGSLFAVYGSGMGPADLVVSNVPLPTNGLSGTVMNITTAGVIVPAPIYFVRSDVVVAVMPSTVPPGNLTLSLNYQGKTATMPITVTQTGFGISNNVIPFASNGVGVLNTAAVTFPDFKAVTGTYTAKPGDILTVWGTGLGATPNGGGDTASPPAGNIGSAPQVFIGGIASPSVTYWGRAPGLIPGLDQINFQVPVNAPLGCNVSIVVQTTNAATPIVSNGPTIALSDTDGGACTDSTQAIPSRVLVADSTKAMIVAVQQETDISTGQNGATTSTTSSNAGVEVFKFTRAQLAAIAAANNAEPTFGTCYTGINRDPNASGPFDVSVLNAGPVITLTPPSGNPLTLASPDTGEYGSARTSDSLPGGVWSFSNGTGGPDVGPLSFKFPVPQPVTWTNLATLTAGQLDRTQALIVRWTGGDANGYVDIQGFAQASSALTGTYYVGFQCAAPVSAGQFSIPPSILLALPPGFANFQLSTNAFPYALGNVSGFDALLGNSYFRTEIPLNLR